MKAVRELLSEVTDIDSRMFKTVIGLFRNPRMVIESSLETQDTYIKPLRYLIFTSSVFIIWRFIYGHYIHGFFIGGKYTEIEDLNLPERIANASSQLVNFLDTFFPFLVLIFVVPLAIIVLKLLFLHKSWKEVQRLTLYAFGQFWILLIPMVPVLVLLDNNLLFPLLVAFGLIGIFFRKILSQKVFVGLIKWIATGFILINWFYHVALPTAQWGLVEILLPDRTYKATEPAKAQEEIGLPITSGFEFVTRDPDNCFLTLIKKNEGMLASCYKSDTTLLWQTLLPGVRDTHYVVRVLLPSSEWGYLILAYGQLPKMEHVLLVSAKGKTLFTKTYNEEIVVNGGDLVNESLVLAGGKPNGEEIAPFIDVLKLKFDYGTGVFHLREEHTHFLPGAGNHFDDVYAVNDSPEGIDLIVSKYETTQPMMSSTAPFEINRVSVMRVTIESVIQTVWETEIFKRTSKYWPEKDYTFQMRYDSTYQRIIAFYSLADNRNTSANLFCLDTLGMIKLQKKIAVNEITSLMDVHSDRDGIYFCGFTGLGVASTFLSLGRQGLVGFVSDTGEVRRVTVGKDQQGHLLFFHKITANDSLIVWGLRMSHFLTKNEEWQLLKFDRQLF